MKKRLFGLALALCMALALLPAAALAADAPTEQYTALEVGKTYYFDLSSVSVPGAEADDLHYVPFIYVGTIDAYKVDRQGSTTGSYPHSLFYSTVQLTKTTWNALNEAGLIYGQDYSSNGITYTLRAPSGGKNGKNGVGDQGGTPENNEYDVMRGKMPQVDNTGRTWAQEMTNYRANSRASRNGPYWNFFDADDESSYAPVLELPAMVEGGLRVVDVNRGNDRIQIVVKAGGSFTAPGVTGLTPPEGMDYLLWEDENGAFYLPGAAVPASVTELTGHWYEDQEPPVVSGLGNEETYCGAVQFTVADNSGGAVTVEVNGSPILPGSDGKYTLDPATGTQTVRVCDAYGNADSVTVTVNNGHTYDWKDGDGQYWQKCRFCGDETAKAAIPTASVQAADTVCRTQDTAFSFTLPEGCTGAEAGYAFPLIGSNVPLTEQDGVYSGTVKAEWYQRDAAEYELSVLYLTTDGYPVQVTKTISIQDAHAGGTADCHNKAICTTCGEAYGEVDKTNHTGGTEVRNASEATCTADGDTGDTVCLGCGEVLQTGTVLPKRHPQLTKVEELAATTEQTGVKVHWHCATCGGDFADAAGSQPLTQAELTIPKLTPTAQKEADAGKQQSPRTADVAAPVAALAALAVAGAGAILIRRKKQ